MRGGMACGDAAHADGLMLVDFPQYRIPCDVTLHGHSCGLVNADRGWSRLIADAIVAFAWRSNRPQSGTRSGTRSGHGSQKHAKTTVPVVSLAVLRYKGYKWEGVWHPRLRRFAQIHANQRTKPHGTAHGCVEESEEEERCPCGM